MSQHPNMPVALVSMPFASIQRPGIGVSLLKASLKEAGIEAEIYYLNLLYASILDNKIYSFISDQVPPSSLVGEWIFSYLVSEAPAKSNYFREVLQSEFSEFFTYEILLQLMFLQQEASAFIDKCFDKVDWGKYKIVGFTSSYQQTCASLALARKIKSRYPQIIIVFGGANCEAEMGIALHKSFGYIDYVCSGEGELAFRELVEMILGTAPTKEIDGIISRVDGCTKVPSKIVHPVPDLNNLPYQSYDDYFDQKKLYFDTREFESVLSFETSRGCWWGQLHHCTFCGLNGLTMAYRSKSSERALAEIVSLQERYGDKFQVVDNILNSDYFNSFLPRLAELETGIELFFEVKANLKKSQVEMLAKAGVKKLQPGIESLNNHVLQLMNKGTTFLQNIQTLKWCKEYGIRVSWNILFGIPGEVAADYAGLQSIIPFIHHLDPPTSCAKVRVDRFSPYFNTPEHFGIRKISPAIAYQFIYAVPEDQIFNMAYYFDYEFPFEFSQFDYITAIKDPVKKWKANYEQHFLYILPDDATFSIYDSRNIARTITWELGSIEQTIIHCCECIQTESTILGTVLKENAEIDIQAVKDCLSALLTIGLVLKDGQHYLSVVNNHGGALSQFEKERAYKYKVNWNKSSEAV